MSNSEGRSVPIFDAHLHIIDPAHPLVPNHGYVPDPFTVSDYRRRTDGLDIRGGAVVSGSFQGFDQGYLSEALPALGPGYVGITQVPARTSDEQISRLHRIGVRGVRFNLVRGGPWAVEELDQLARRVHELAGWHVELYIDASGLEQLERRIAALPAVVIDHLGLEAAALPVLLWLIEQGVKVKATGFGRIDFDPVRAAGSITAIDPAALMVGTDLPSTRARRPFQWKHLDMIAQALDHEQVTQVFWANAADFYLGRDSSPGPP